MIQAPVPRVHFVLTSIFIFGITSNGGARAEERRQVPASLHGDLILAATSIIFNRGEPPVDCNVDVNAFAQLSHRFFRDPSVGTGGEVFRSFGLVNPRFNGEAYWHAAGPLDLYARIAGNAAPPDKQFLPNWQALVGGELTIVGPFQFLLQLEHRRYTISSGINVEIVQPGLLYHFGSASLEGKAAIEFLRPGLGDSSNTLVGIGRFDGSRRTVHPGGFLAVAGVSGIFAGVRFPIAPSWALRVDLTGELRNHAPTAPAYEGLSTSFAFTHKF